MASIDLSPVPLGMRDMFLLMSSTHVMGLSYHRWLHLVAALFFLLFISYAVTGRQERPVKLFSIYGCFHAPMVHLVHRRREQMAADPHRLFMSVEEYLELDRNSVDARYEYIDGVVTMLAGGTTNHSRISVNVVSLLRAALRGSPCEVFNSDLRVSISSTRYVLPDASVSCVPGDLEGENDTISSPCVIVEVLSPSTEATDRGKKFRYYQSCLSIQEYVLISTQEQAVDVYRRASDNLWTLHPFGPGDEVELKSIDVSIPLEALYENVTVPRENA